MVRIYCQKQCALTELGRFSEESARRGRSVASAWMKIRSIRVQRVFEDLVGRESGNECLNSVLQCKSGSAQDCECQVWNLNPALHHLNSASWNNKVWVNRLEKGKLISKANARDEDNKLAFFAIRALRTYSKSSSGAFELLSSWRNFHLKNQRR